MNLCQSPNKQLQRTVPRRRGHVASAPFHYAHAARFTRQRAPLNCRFSGTIDVIGSALRSLLS